MPRQRDHDDFDDFWYAPSRPREAKDGIKAKSKSGAFGSSWWARRWIEVLEAFEWGSRLQRGRTYARQGQVLRIAVEVGRVRADVQGSRPRPYKVTLNITPLSDAEWSQAIDVMAQQAVFAAKLLTGEMPQEIETAFTAVGVALFPRSEYDLVTECSCPDVANPCKHIAAVYYLLGERFDEDPFLIFHLRGRTRAQLIDALRSRRTTGGDRDAAAAAAEPVPALADQLAGFYQADAALTTLSMPIAAPEMATAIVQQLGPAPAEVDADLRAVYQAMTAHVLDNLFGES